MNAPDEEVEAGPSASMDDINGLGEPVIGVVSPVEGGDCYNRDAVLQVAQRLDAEVLRIDLALALGLSGPSGPLGLKGKASNIEITGQPFSDTLTIRWAVHPRQSKPPARSRAWSRQRSK
jgi:hypothetical protein